MFDILQLPKIVKSGEWNIMNTPDFVIVQIVKDGKAIRSVIVDRQIKCPEISKDIVNIQPMTGNTVVKYSNVTGELSNENNTDILYD